MVGMRPASFWKEKARFQGGLVGSPGGARVDGWSGGAQSDPWLNPSWGLGDQTGWKGKGVRCAEKMGNWGPFLDQGDSGAKGKKESFI